MRKAVKMMIRGKTKCMVAGCCAAALMASVASAQKRAAPRPVKPLPPGTVINYLSPRTGEMNANGSPRAPAERRVPAARAVPPSQQTAQQSEKPPPGTPGFRVKVQDVPGRTAEAVQPGESCCFPDGICLTFPGCALKGGTPVEVCQGPPRRTMSR